MAVVSIAESWSGVTWSGDTSQAQTVRVFTVETDTPGRGYLDFPMTSNGVTIPAFGTPHPDNEAFLSGVPTITTKGPTFFEVRVPYVAVGIAAGENNPNQNPLDEPADYSWSSEVRQVPYDRDLTGALTVNVMGEAPDPPLTREIKDPVLVIERNEAAFDPDDKLAYQDTVSDGSFWGAPAGRARLTDLDGRSVNASVPYWRKAYRIVFRMRTPDGVDDADAWKRFILHQGTKYIDGNGAVQLAPNGQLVLLAADGTRTTKDNPTWLGPFVEYPPANWSGLGIDG
jgi:hypothetical protein